MSPRKSSPPHRPDKDGQIANSTRVIRGRGTRARFHILKNKLWACEVAGRSFPWSSHLRGRKVNFALQQTWPRSVLGGKVGEKRSLLIIAPMPRTAFTPSGSAVSSGNAEISLRRAWPCVLGKVLRFTVLIHRLSSRVSLNDDSRRFE